MHNVSLRIVGPTDIVLIREVIDHPDFKPSLAILGRDVEDMAAIMDPDVAAWILPDRSQILFRRVVREEWQLVNAELDAKGWLGCGCQAVRSYGSLLEYQASPG